ncbi:hypothetical protein HQ560_13255, partial [bacterium]|nr:hypothetical protein [bacterium]
AEAHVGDGRYEHRFTDGVPAANCWHSLWRTTPSRDVALDFRRIFLRPDPDRPLGVFILECTLTALRDLDAREVLVGTMAPAGARLWQVAGRGGVRSGRVEEAGRSPQRTLHVSLGRGGHVALYDSPLGAAAFYAMTDGLVADVDLPRANVRLTLTGKRVPRKAGDRCTVRLVGLGIPRSTPATRRIGAPTTEIVARYGRDFGIDGTPAWKVVPSAGTVAGRTVFIEIDGSQSACFRGRMEGEPCSSVPIRVTGANPRWSACLWDAARGIRPVPVFEGATWAVTEVRGKADLFVGHPVVADNPKCVITAVHTDPSTWAIGVHNPTDQALTATVRPNPAFDPLAAQAAERVELAPGASRQWQWKSADLRPLKKTLSR